jgi:GNAT superfamily N-acetyltransferase
MADIREADLPADVAALKSLWLEYGTWACDQLETQYGFRESAREVVEHDIATIERFQSPDGGLLLAFRDDVAVGTVCMQRIGAEVAELKRMYVRPAYRQIGLGRALVDELITLVGRSGYRRIRLDSPGFMKDAHRLYRASGFVDIGPYPGSEIPESYRPHWLFMERTLGPEGSD